jgi:hypothetical protein
VQIKLALKVGYLAAANALFVSLPATRNGYVSSHQPAGA